MSYYYVWSEPRVVINIHFGDEVAMYPSEELADNYIDYDQKRRFTAWLASEHIPEKHLSDCESFIFKANDAEKVKKWLAEHNMQDWGHVVS